MELVRFTPVVDRRWGGKMQRMAQGGCAGRGTRQNTGENVRKWGTLDEKRGTLSGMFPMFASSYREVEEKSKRKSKKGAEEVKRYGRNAQFGAAQRAECGGRTEKARRVGKTLAVRWRRNGKIILSLQHQNHFPPNQHRWNSSSTNAESPWCDCSNR